MHGGEFKAVYCYPSEHYGFWKQEMSASDFPTDHFGENLTTEGMFENSLYLAIASASERLK